MGIEKIIIVILLAIIILPWLFYSDNLGSQLKKQIIIVVDALAFLIFCVAKVGILDKILTIVILFVMCIFWIAYQNYGKKEISLQELKESCLDDMCFCIGIGIIILFLVQMLFGKIDY